MNYIEMSHEYEDSKKVRKFECDSGVCHILDEQEPPSAKKKDVPVS